MIATCAVSDAIVQQEPQPESADLLVRFRHANPFWYQLNIGEQIVELKSAELINSLASWLNHEDRHVRGNVAFLFVALGDSRGLSTIEGILDDRSPRREGQGVPTAGWSLARQIRADRYYAVHLLGVLKRADALDILLPRLADEELNYKVAWALAQIGDARAIEPLIHLLRHRDALARVSAIQSLTTMKATQSLPFLRAMLDDHAMPSAGDRLTVAQVAGTGIATLEEALTEGKSQR